MRGFQITAVVPYYNMGCYVADAVRSLLSQSWPALDVIIVDDGSDEENRQALSRFEGNPRVRVMHQAHAGGSAARNRGFEAAGGKYIIFLDADDILEASFAEKAAAILEANEDICLVASLSRFFGDRKGHNKRQPYTVENILLGNSHSGFGMFRKSDWEAMPGKEIPLPYGQDWDFWVSMISSGKRAFRIEEFLYNYRRHGASISSRRRSRRAEKIDVTAYMLEKHRDFYAKYPDVIAGLTHDLESAMPRFMEFKKRKYRLIIFLSSLPGLGGILSGAAQKARNKLEYFESL